MPLQGEPVTRAHEARQLLAQRGLADARLTRQHDQGTITVGRGRKGCLQVLQLERAADEHRTPAAQVVAKTLLFDRLAGCVCGHALCGAL